MLNLSDKVLANSVYVVLTVTNISSAGWDNSNSKVLNNLTYSKYCPLIVCSSFYKHSTTNGNLSYILCIFNESSLWNTLPNFILIFSLNLIFLGSTWILSLLFIS